MKTVSQFLVLLMALLSGLKAPTALASSGASVRECSSAQGTGQELTLFIFDEELKQLRVQTAAVRARALPFQKLATQNVPGFTVFTILVSGAIMQIENSVLAGNAGHIEITGDSFTCQ